jgi:uncharacterized damage-inducible protein DinB
MNYLNQILNNQFEAALAMLNQCIAACPPDHWEGKIASSTFRQTAYHTLFFVDFYLSRENHFTLRDLHHQGGDERGPTVSPGLSKEATLAYLQICRLKMQATLAAESPEILQSDSGFPYRKFTRGELHLYNIRHIQHHTGQLSAYLRKADPTLADHKALPWIGSGWR